MHDDVLVKVENVSKKFCRSLKRSLMYGIRDLGGEFLGRDHHDELRKDEFWALKDVSFELKRGECLGIVGPNGAGKTTLLRLLNGLIKPDKGRITMRGRVQALIALGAGFNPILTARENIYVNASVLAIAKREIDKRLDEIIDFAEIGDFIDAPVQSYSSGMKVRLGFSVAMAMQPDILLIDEVLAVGDLRFRNKCLDSILRIKNSGSSFLFVSHNVNMVKNLSDKVVYLKNGKVEYLGNPTDTLLHYMGAMLSPTEKFVHMDGTEEYIILHEVHILDKNSLPVDTIETEQSLKLRLVFDVRKPIQNSMFQVFFVPYGQDLVAAIMNYQENELLPSFPLGRHTLEIHIPSFPLLAGNYTLGVRISSGEERIIKYARIDNVASIDVNPKPGQFTWNNRSGFVKIESTWKAV